MTYKKLIEDLEKEIKFFGGTDFDKRKDVDLTDEGDLTATLKSTKLSALKQARQITLKEELEFLEKLYDEFKFVYKSGNTLLNERIKKIKGELK